MAVIDACPIDDSKRRTGFFKKLGPGLITGASDDDPSGIGTYSQAGAAFGYSLLWTMFLTMPLMAAIQEISARLGRITGHGIAGNIRKHYSAWLLYPIVLLLLVANTINIGADIGAMGDATRLLINGPAILYSILFAGVIVVLQVFGSYQRCCSVFKLLSLVLFSYILTTFLVHVSWPTVLKFTVIPKFQNSSSYWATFIAVLGTTISPYLFFWQASQETEEIKSHSDEEALKKAPQQANDQFKRIRFDTYIGMAFSNIVAFFIIVAAGATLNAHGITDIETSAQAAEALRPLAGRAAFLLFTIGIVGTGLLAVPVLAGSAAYAVGEALRWPTGMDRKPLAVCGDDPLHTGWTFHQLPGDSEVDAYHADSRAVLVCRHQWHRRGPHHGDCDADGRQQKGHGTVRTHLAPASSHGLARNRSNGRGGGHDDRLLEIMIGAVELKRYFVMRPLSDAAAFARARSFSIAISSTVLVCNRAAPSV
jgi:NRAMP (natural resistance-associated macrophage protein)-like metal ion transporter